MADVSQIKLPNGDTFDLVDEKSGYITAQYIENRIDYSIPVSRVGEIVVGETAIGTDSTNFPTSKAVVDYVDERVVQEIGAIDVGVTGIKANGTSLAVNNGVVNIPVAGKTQTIGLMDFNLLASFQDYLESQIPTSTSQLTNDSGFITSETDPTVPAWAKAATKPTYTASEVGALPSDTVITDEKLKVNLTSDNGTYYPILTSDSTDAQTKLRYSGLYSTITDSNISLTIGKSTMSGSRNGQLRLTKNTYYTTIVPSNNGQSNTITLPNKSGTVALLDDIPSIPTNISSFTNDSGYLTASDIASVMTYKGTKANYAALPSTGNTTGDVWHLTDTGAEWAWDGSAWQELGTAIDLSGYVPTSRTINGKALTSNITLSASDVGAIDTETDPVFSASAASGITSTDITNWNGKSSTDEKLVTNAITADTNYYLLLGSDTTNATTKYYDAKGLQYKWNSALNPNGVELILGNNLSSGSNRRRGILTIYGSGANYLQLQPPSIMNSSYGLILPNQSGTIALTSDIPTVPTKVSDLTNDSGFISSYTETDPVFSASPAAGISATDISNWNGKVNKSGDTMTGNLTMGDNELLFIHDGKTIGIKGTHYYQSNYDTTYYGISFRVGSSNAILLRNVKSPITDSDAANKAYVDSAVGGITVPTKTSELTNDSGFITSYTDEKLGLSLASSPVYYYPILTQDTTTAGKKSYDNDGFQYYNYNGTTSDVGNAKLTLGNNKTATTAKNKRGTLELYGSTAYAIRITAGAPTVIRNIEFPNKDGIVALTSDIPQVYSSTNTGGYLTMATLPIYDGTVE